MPQQYDIKFNSEQRNVTFTEFILQSRCERKEKKENNTPLVNMSPTPLVISVCLYFFISLSYVLNLYLIFFFLFFTL